MIDIHDATAISLEALLKLRHVAQQLKIRHSKNLMTIAQGNMLSRLRGRGLEFNEVRPYQAGDDIRTMEWRVTARTGIAHTKIYHEEKERPVYILVDFRENMHFATQMAFKSVIAAYVATLIAWASMLKGDRLGGIIFSDHHIEELRPLSRKKGVLKFINTLVKQFNNRNNTDDHPEMIYEAIQKLSRLARHSSLIYMISDFRYFDDSIKSNIANMAKSNEIIAIHIADPIEMHAPAANHYGISDGRLISSLDTTSKTFCNEYNAYFENKIKWLKSFLRQYRIPLWQIATNDSIIDKLKEYFHG